MRQFAAVIRELRAWLYQVPFARALMPIHLHLLYMGVGVLLLKKLLYESVSLSSYDTLHDFFYDFPLYLIAYYSFFVGFWLTLVSRDVRLLPFAMWAYAFMTLFPFKSLGLEAYVRAFIYIVAGLALLRYSASSYSSNEKRTGVY
ncbi:hypothetical protein [Cohnella yongneupensis]|uniref:Uncharacterized protein n=1 Tax=Cohnella yongneupensis TaxID=425006 RepID=A0ABW0QYV8_9BACL